MKSAGLYAHKENVHKQMLHNEMKQTLSLQGHFLNNIPISKIKNASNAGKFSKTQIKYEQNIEKILQGKIHL